MLRHQLAFLQRRQPRWPKLNWADRALVATLLGVVPKARRQGLRLLVTPDTIVRWHRDIVRRRQAARSKRGRTGRPATRRNIQALVRRLARENPGWGIPQDPRRARRTRRKGRSVHRLGDPQGQRHRPSPAADRADLVTIPALPGRGDPGAAFFTIDLLDGTQAYVLAAIDHATRRISIPGLTLHPTGGMDRPAGPQPDHGSRRPRRPGQVHDPRPRIKLHHRVRRRPRRCRDPDRALQHPDAPDERDHRTLDRGDAGANS